MANPKRKTSKGRRNRRRSHDALSRPASSICPECSEPKRPHNICAKCGSYKGKEVVQIEEAAV